MKRIIFNLKLEWYEQIASGEKTVEYRSLVDKNGNRSKWCAIFGIDPNKFFHETETFTADESVKPSAIAPNDWFAVFRVGYPSNSKPRKWPDIVRRIVKIDIGPCPYTGWDGDYFRIYIEPNCDDCPFFRIVEGEGTCVPRCTNPFGKCEDGGSSNES